MLQVSNAVLALLEVAEGVSRVHASRRFFEYLHRQQIDIPVIHHRSFEAGRPSSGFEFVLYTPANLCYMTDLPGDRSSSLQSCI